MGNSAPVDGSLSRDGGGPREGFVEHQIMRGLLLPGSAILGLWTTAPLISPKSFPSSPSNGRPRWLPA